MQKNKGNEIREIKKNRKWKYKKVHNVMKFLNSIIKFDKSKQLTQVN